MLHVFISSVIQFDKSIHSVVLYELYLICIFRKIHGNCDHWVNAHFPVFRSEVKLPNSKPFLICTVYQPSSTLSTLIDSLEEELSAAQSTGLEMILMGDVNFDYHTCTNNYAL